MELLPPQPYLGENVFSRGVALEGQSEEDVPTLIYRPVAKINVADELHFSGVIDSINCDFAIYHGTVLVDTITNTGPFGRDHTATTQADYFMFTAVGPPENSAALVEAVHMSVTRAD